MPKLHKKVRQGENRYEKLHEDMNKHLGPTRLEPVGSYPVYYIPNLDPMQKQMNRLENAVNREVALRRRRAWRNKSQRS